nr:complement factor H-like isoform X2 [Misgurnus anguillicaudatus]
MRVPLKLFSFSFGIFFLTFAQGQGVDECRAFPSILHGQLNIEQSVVEVKCDPGFKSSHTVIICINGTWQTPTCELDEQSCVSPPKVNNALIISKPQTLYSSGSYVNYKCLTNFSMSGNSKVECHDAKWEKAPTCEALCSKPLQIVNNAILIDQIQSQRKYSHGDTAHYECVEDYESNEQTIAKCDVQTWIYPECIKKAQCTKPTINLQFVTLLDEKNTFNNFDVLRYTCNKPYDKIPNGTLICKAGKWNSTFDCTSSICPPPPMIEDGDFNIEQKTGEVITEVSYLCQSYFVLDKPNNYRCLDGIWETPPKCLKPCKITPDIYKEYNIKPILDDYIRHSAEEVRLDCNDGWTVGGFSRQSYSKALCYDGELRIENKCTEENFFG